MNNRFQNDADRLLSPLCWRESDQARVLSALKGEKPIMKKKLGVGFILAAVLALLAAVALAVGLTYSPRFTAIQTARQALMEKYHLTQEMVRMFSWEETSERDGITVTEYYIMDGQGSQFTNPEAMGRYTVTQDGRGNATVAWSHDGVAPSVWMNGDLNSPVWGAPQLQALLDRYAAYQQWWKENEDVYKLSMAQQKQRFAELDRLVAPLKLADGPIDPNETPGLFAAETVEPNATPDAIPTQAPAPTPMPGDLPAEQLILLARQAMAEEYGLTEQEMDTYWITVWYQYDAEGHCGVDFNGSQTCGYVVLNPANGEIQQVKMDSALSGNG